METARRRVSNTASDPIDGGGSSTMDGKADLSKLKIERGSSNGGTERPGARWKWYAVLVILLAVVIFLVRWKVVSPDSPLVEIDVVTTTGGGYGSSSMAFPILTANGYVMPRVKASVGPRIAGQLVELFVEEGSRVKKGDLLGRLDNRDLKARERQIEAEIESQKALLDEARANREEIRLEFERQENLIREGAVSQSNYDKAKTSLKVADARVSSAEARL
jgi:multidrug efflux pump subunit AcrA (membrane-fusion protein)